MGKLKDYAAKSDLMNISITLGKETFKFNLFAELVVDERKINHELTEQPSAYAFLSLLHKKLYRKLKDTEQELKVTYAKLYAKQKTEPTQAYSSRGPNKDLVEQRVIKNSTYQAQLSAYNDIEHQTKIIEACLRSFEQRKDLIQTLAANLRKEI